MSFGKVTPEQKQEVEQYGSAIYSWDEFLQLVGYPFTYCYPFSAINAKIDVKTHFSLDQ